MNNDLISREALKKAITQDRNIDRNAVCDVLDIIDNAPTVEPTFGLFRALICKDCQAYATNRIIAKLAKLANENTRPHGKWNVKEGVVACYTACNQCGYADYHHKRSNFCPNCGADMRGDNTCKGCIHNRGSIPGTDDIQCGYIEDRINNNRCEYYEEDNNNGNP